MHGETTPQDSEVLSIAGLIGIKVYNTLGLAEPDKDLLKANATFSHLSGILNL
jgi:hypothetical protein